ncbi:MAG: bifunctional chorismate mutase/prephenate dehydratase [Clostridiaceae bacterium]|nr:bifunctional chorismate mutase/prephenate dehydratase [Clostridiaceae bacterium]
MEKLKSLRKKFDEIDEELVSLFIKRMELAALVGEYKARENLKIYDPLREKEILQRFAGSAKVDFDKKYIEEFLENLIFLSRRLQEGIAGENNKPSKHESPYPVKGIGYQGVPGCYSYEAVFEYFGGEVETLNFRSFRDVFKALAEDDIQYGVLPIENSTSGSINEVYDLLREYEFHIAGEKCIPVEHNLIGVEGAEVSDIREVYSHQQGLIQCSRIFLEHPEWKQVPYFDTAGSAEYIAKEDLKYKACIAGRMAASVYGLKIIKEGIQDNRNNSTRFVIVRKEKQEAANADKISIIVSVPHKPGTLSGLIKHFAESNCNLMKIESRPLIGKAWEYFFYIDFEGNLKEKNIRTILRDIEKECTYFRLLGNYKSERGSKL